MTSKDMLAIQEEANKAKRIVEMTRKEISANIRKHEEFVQEFWNCDDSLERLCAEFNRLHIGDTSVFICILAL